MEGEEQKEIKKEEEQRAAVFEKFERKRRRLMNRVNHHRKYEIYKEKKKKKLRSKTEARQPSEVIKRMQKIRMGEVSKTSEVPPAIPPPPPSRVGSSNSTWTWDMKPTSRTSFDLRTEALGRTFCQTPTTATSSSLLDIDIAEYGTWSQNYGYGMSNGIESTSSTNGSGSGSNSGNGALKTLLMAVTIL